MNDLSIVRSDGDTPVVAIVGRPNVGKSTLFNRLIGYRHAIVSDVAGTTRDRVIGRVQWDDKSFLLVDTGGLDFDVNSDLDAQVQSQVNVAIEDADCIIFLTDCVDGLTPTDVEVGEILRKSQKHVVLAVNKVDNALREHNIYEFYELGLGDPSPISAYHKIGIDELMAQLIKIIPPHTAAAYDPDTLRLSIVGRTNVGKSSLINSIVQEERAVVSDQAGTTRDPVDTFMDYGGRSVVLVDTAGIRRRGKVEQGIEKYSVIRSIKSIARSDVSVLVIDARDPMSAQDLHIAGDVLSNYVGMIVAVNKWDLVKDQDTERKEYMEWVEAQLRFASYVPIIFCSALTGEGINDLLSNSVEVFEERKKIIPGEELRELLFDALIKHPPPGLGRRTLKIYDLRQIGVNPPAFSLSVNNPAYMHFSYKRYLENEIRRKFGFKGNHLQLRFQRRGEQ
jgi:GTP-binding protein